MYHAAAALCIRAEAEDAKPVKGGLFDVHFTGDDNNHLVIRYIITR